MWGLDYCIAFTLLLYTMFSGSVAFIYRYLDKVGIIHPWYKVETSLADVVSLAVLEAYPMIPALILLYLAKGEGVTPGARLCFEGFSLRLRGCTGT